MVVWNAVVYFRCFFSIKPSVQSKRMSCVQPPSLRSFLVYCVESTEQEPTSPHRYPNSAKYTEPCVCKTNNFWGVRSGTSVYTSRGVDFSKSLKMFGTHYISSALQPLSTPAVATRNICGIWSAPNHVATSSDFELTRRTLLVFLYFSSASTIA